MDEPHHRGSYWNLTAPQRSDFPALAENLKVDIAIVGGGMVGVTTARLLKDQGLTVALVEARQVGQQATGKSTAKLTSQHGLLYQTLNKKFDNYHALLYADAQEGGLAEIRRLVAEFSIDCDLETAEAYTYTCQREHVESIQTEVEIAKELGLPATLVYETDLPFAVEAAIRYENQAQFHPTRYVAGLAATIPGQGCHVFENSPVLAWEPTRVTTASGTIEARHVVMATHLPLGMTGGYYARAFPDAEPVIAAPIERIPKGMFVNVETPGRSIRTHLHKDGTVYAIVAGNHFKPGDTLAEQESFAELEGWLKEHFGARTITHRWVNEDYTAMDHVPFVGWSTSHGDDYLIATGFAGWGLTNGTAAAMMLRDLVTGSENRWLELFNAKRIRPVAGGKEFLKESAGVAAHLLKGHLSRKPNDINELAPGDGAIMKIDGRKMAVHRDDQGRLHQVSATCTHMGCVLGWNDVDRTWDCPCHGSRFAVDGSVIHGPAVKPLKHYTP